MPFYLQILSSAFHQFRLLRYQYSYWTFVVFVVLLQLLFFIQHLT